jgi:hypothetical protein
MRDVLFPLILTSLIIFASSRAALISKPDPAIRANRHGTAAATGAARARAPRCVPLPSASTINSSLTRSRRPPHPLPSCTDWTRLALLPVLTGHVSSFSLAPHTAPSERAPPTLTAAASSRGAGTPPPSLPYKLDTSRPSLRTNWTRLAETGRRGRRQAAAPPRGRPARPGRARAADAAPAAAGAVLTSLTSLASLASLLGVDVALARPALAALRAARAARAARALGRLVGGRVRLVRGEGRGVST